MLLKNTHTYEKTKLLFSLMLYPGGRLGHYVPLLWKILFFWSIKSKKQCFRGCFGAGFIQTRVLHLPLIPEFEVSGGYALLPWRPRYVPEHTHLLLGTITKSIGFFKNLSPLVIYKNKLVY
jgi:hypothetical protein